MSQRLYIDANCGIGRTKTKEERIPYKIETLLEEMAYYRTHASLIYSNEAIDYSFIKGNAVLLEHLKIDKRLYGIATVINDIQYELEEGYGYYDKLLNERVKGFKVYPKTFQHGFDPFSMEGLAEYMVDKKLPLVIDLQECEWRDLKDCLCAFPDLKFVLCNASWSDNRFLFRLMEHYTNLYFDISSNQANDILNTCKKHFGLDRVLFGSQYPYKTMGALKAMVEYSGLSEDDKDAVSFKNSARLFKIDENVIEPYPEEECKLDEIALRVDNGKPLDGILVIDSHTHMADSEHLTISRFPMIKSDEHALVSKMGILGIDKIITSPWEGITTNGFDANISSVKAVECYRGKIEAYVTCNPNYPEDLKAAVDIFHRKNRFIGLKPYCPSHGNDLLDPRYEKWFTYGNEHRLMMLVHSETTDVADQVEKLCEMYPEMTFILAHSGAYYALAKRNSLAARRRSNIYVEITYTTLTNGIIEYLVEEAGADKVLFGTDMPMRDPAPQLAWVCYARIPLEDKKKILGSNVLKIIKRCDMGGIELW